MIQLTGLSCSGKTTIAEQLKTELSVLGYKCEIIDGDYYRQNICSDLGFSKEDRITNIRRLGTIATILEKHGIIPIIAAINPYEEIRQELGGTVVYLNCSLEECIRRDVKGLYKRALSGEIPNFTGISDVYEIPKNPDLILNTQTETIEESTNKLLKFIINKQSRPKALFIGRWQPWHNGHSELINTKLKLGIPILIAVRDILPDEKNPFTTDQTVNMIKTVYKDNPLVDVIIIPDIESVNYGRGVGYEINNFVPNKEVAAISATKIRELITLGSDEWKSFVDPKIHDAIFNMIKHGFCKS